MQVSARAVSVVVKKSVASAAVAVVAPVEALVVVVNGTELVTVLVDWLVVD